jgi:hypothetical protein
MEERGHPPTQLPFFCRRLQFIADLGDEFGDIFLALFA